MKPNRYIQIYGERSSGTNFLHFLLEENIQKITVGYKYGWKHGFPKIQKIAENKKNNDLFFCIVKEPFSWIVSMHGKPHHAPQLFKMRFSEFIRSEWACYKGNNFDKRDLNKEPLLKTEEMLHERNPETNKRFENVIKLREGKIKHLLKLKEAFPNQVIIINYESLLMKPRISICDIAKSNGLKLKGPVKISMGYFGKNPNLKFDRKNFYINKEYLNKYSAEDIKFVKTQLNTQLESKIGYEINSTNY